MSKSARVFFLLFILTMRHLSQRTISEFAAPIPAFIPLRLEHLSPVQTSHPPILQCHPLPLSPLPLSQTRTPPPTPLERNANATYIHFLPNKKRSQTEAVVRLLILFSFMARWRIYQSVPHTSPPTNKGDHFGDGFRPGTYLGKYRLRPSFRSFGVLLKKRRATRRTSSTEVLGADLKI